MSLQFKILIDDKIIGEVSKDVSKIDKSTDFSEPVSLILHVTPAAEKVRYITCLSFLQKYSCDFILPETRMRGLQNFLDQVPENHDFLIELKSSWKTGFDVTLKLLNF